MLINNATYQRETLSERPIRQPLTNVHSKPLICYDSSTNQKFINSAYVVIVKRDAVWHNEKWNEKTLISSKIEFLMQVTP